MDMDIKIADTNQKPPVDRGYAISIVIADFKGHKNVAVHLFRPDWNAEDLQIYDWQNLLGDPIQDNKEIDPLSSRKVLIETFNKTEKDIILEYLQTRYGSRLVSITVTVIPFPIPLGLMPLSEVPEQNNIGIIRFNEIPNYPLTFPFHGLYELNKHY